MLLFLLLAPVWGARLGREDVAVDAFDFAEETDDQSCTTKLRKLYCCQSSLFDKGRSSCKDGKREVCSGTHMKCYFGWRGSTCRCEEGYCYDSTLKKCVLKEAEVEVKSKVRKQATSMRVEDAFDNFLGYAAGAAGVVAGTAWSPVSLVLSPFQNMARAGARQLASHFAASQLNQDIQKVESWLHYAMSSFVLSHDDPEKNCNLAPMLSLSGTKVDYGKCYLSLENPDDVPLWAGPLYSYTDGKGNGFNISLSVKAGQIRCLEKLQVQKSRCYGNVLANGGLCKLELAPSASCPVNVTDLEVEIYCEGHCQVSDRVRSLLSWGEADNSMEIGKKVYIYKEGSAKYGTKCKGELHMITKTYERCDLEGKNCLRHCLDGNGCWHKSNLLTERYCERWWKQGARKLVNKLSAVAGTSSEAQHVTLIYRKVNAILREVKVRADVYIFRARSLEDAIDSDAADTRNSRTKKGIWQSFKNAFNKVQDAKDDVGKAALGLIRSEHEATKAQMALIKRYGLNLQPRRNEKGELIGYEPVLCNWLQWNNESQAYDLPPMRHCQKIRLVNLQLLATQENYLEIEELSSSQKQSSSMAGSSPGIVLSLVAKIARTMFVRHSATIVAPDPSGAKQFCKDMWATGERPDLSYAVGVQCQSASSASRDEDEVPDGVDARYEFEIVELAPVWNEAEKRNEQLIGLRGGYNLNWCRVLASKDPKTKLKAGSLVCDLDLPTQEGSEKLLEPLPVQAQFRLEHTGKNKLLSNVVFARGAKDHCEGKCEEDEEVAREQVEETLGDSAGAENSLEIRLVSEQTQQYCRTAEQTFQTWRGFSSKKKVLLSCDFLDGHDDPSTLLSLSGSTDGLAPNKYWNFVIILSLTALMTSIGLTTSKFAALLGGAALTIGSVIVHSAVGFGLGVALSATLQQQYHFDGMVLRYLANSKVQEIGQQILFLVESALEFEIPRL